MALWLDRSWLAVAMVVMIVDNLRTRPQAAYALGFQFQRRAVGIEAGAFTQSPLLRQRNEATQILRLP